MARTARKTRIDLDAGTFDAAAAVEHGNARFVTHGNPFFGEYGPTVSIGGNGDQAGGLRWAAAESEGVSLSNLHFYMPLYGGNLFV